MLWHQNEWFRRLIRSKIVVFYPTINEFAAQFLCDAVTLSVEKNINDQWNERHIGICLCCSGLEFRQRPEFHWLKVLKNPFFIDPVFGHRNQNVASFSGRIREKVVKTHVTLIICFEVLFKRIDYGECLLHAVIFSPEFCRFTISQPVPFPDIVSVFINSHKSDIF